MSSKKSKRVRGRGSNGPSMITSFATARGGLYLRFPALGNEIQRAVTGSFVVDFNGLDEMAISDTTFLKRERAPVLRLATVNGLNV